MGIRSIMTALALSLLLFAGASCAGYGNVGTETRTVNAAGARSVQASLSIGSGQIDIGGGADPLMHASFTTNDKRTPTVNYQVHDGIGTITVTQSAKPTGFNLGPITNRWSVNLNDDIPIDLKVDSQSAKANLSLDTLTVKTLNFSTSSGNSTIGLSGDQNQLSAVSLRSASGDIHLTMDGDYRGSTNLQIDSSSGSVTTDLNGKWAGKLNGNFKSDSGSITITVPKNLGVQVSASTDSGYIDVAGFSSQGGGIYVSDTSSSIMMSLTIRTSSGNITLRQAG